MLTGGTAAGVFILGLDYGSSPTVVFRDQAGQELSRLTTGLTQSASVRPPGWAGVWENITFISPADVVARLDGGAQLTIEVWNDGGASAPLPIGW